MHMEYYHVINRGVDKRLVVKDDFDRLRFVHSLYVFNDTCDVDPNHRLANYSPTPQLRNPLVHIHAWALMPNHYHFLLSARVEHGISLFLKKLNGGYARYFNERYNRTGALWQGRSKQILVVRDAHFLYLPYYIHLNPLDMKYPEWREGKVRSPRKALSHLETYRWSSFKDYLGIKNFPSLLYTNELKQTLGSPKRIVTECAELIGTDNNSAQFQTYPE